MGDCWTRLAEDKEKDVACVISRSTLVYATGKRILEIILFWSESIPSFSPTEVVQKAKVSTSNERSVWYADTAWDSKQGHTIPGVLLACDQARDTRSQGCNALPGAEE